MQQANGCTVAGSPVVVRWAGCKGRPLLFPGWGQGGPPLHFRLWSKRRGWCSDPFLGQGLARRVTARRDTLVWIEGDDPAEPNLQFVDKVGPLLSGFLLA